jgi:hypothetical protein
MFGGTGHNICSSIINDILVSGYTAKKTCNTHAIGVRKIMKNQAA